MKKDQGAKEARKGPRVRWEKKGRKENQDLRESMVAPVTRENSERKEGPEILDDKDHRARRDLPYRREHPYPVPGVLRARLVIRVHLDETVKRAPPVPWDIVAR